MQRTLVLLLLVLTSESIVFGKNENKPKTNKVLNKISSGKDTVNKERIKRSLDDGSVNYFFPVEDKIVDKLEWYENNLDDNDKRLLNKEIPFWGTRGRRDSASDESVADVPLTTHIHYNFFGKTKNVHKLPAYHLKQRQNDREAPFWGNRGRRASDESDESDIDLFWANRGRRQDEEPFWGTRGRRQEEAPFWGNRGRRENFFSQLEPEDNEPFWGNRGRRETLNRAFEGKVNKLRSQKYLNEETEPFWGNRGRRKIDFKETMIKALNQVQKNIDKVEREMNSKGKSVINGSTKIPLQFMQDITNLKPNNELRSKPFEQNTLHDDRISAEEPHYILIERSSRSSEEDDPFYITRGKKYLQLAEATRGRRGALEDIVKSVRNDPFYIARGKKDKISKPEKSSAFQNRVLKAKDLICATIELLKANKTKRQASDSERDRRTTLKKLALQLQMDPYFVSRGKKGFESDIDLESVEQFIDQISRTCN